jgi:DNA ligase D-like protein (predicted ligase)
MQPSPLAFIEPMDPTLVDKPPEGDQWFHEIKYDGYRSQIAIAGREVCVYTRNGYDWTKKYRLIADAARDLVGRDVRIDGEIIVQDEAGRPDFHTLRRSITVAGDRLVFYAFDLLSLDSEDLRGRPCEERRAMLAALLASVTPADPIHFSQAFEGSGEEFYEAIDKLGLEGMVSKRRSSVYRSGRTTDWVKTKTFTVGEFTIVGYDRSSGKAATLLVAREAAGRLHYAGRVMVTTGGKAREALWERLEKRIVDVPPLPELKRKDATWVKPGLKTKVRHLRGEETLRHATMVA